MAIVLQCVYFAIIASFLALASSDSAKKSYVVYMGGNLEGNNPEDSQTLYMQMLSSVLNEEEAKISITQSYHHAFSGFSAMLTEQEAAALSSHDEVVSVFPDRVLQLHTTRSWDFLEVQSGLRPTRLNHRASGDVIIGVIDTGIWPELPSFSDAGMPDVPSRWRGVCMEGFDFKKTQCNRKIIGARFYSYQPESNDTHVAKLSAFASPRDAVGHGTHTSSTAAGAVVTGASYYGLAQGTAKGGSPSSRLAMYKACSLGGCASSAVLKAIDDAVNDGVDVISISIGMSSVFQTDYLSDPIAIGAFHAQQRGVVVVCSGGNDGPDPFTVVNSAPWIVTVAASSIDRAFQSSIVLGNGAVIKGVGINFSNLSISGQYPLVFGANVAAPFTPATEASNCYPGSLSAVKAAGKIVVCINSDPTVSRKVKKLVAQGARARGLILIDDVEKNEPLDSGVFPFSQVGSDLGAMIFQYMNSTKSPVGVILATENVDGVKPAPAVAYFSARGPGGLTEAILKPDLMAPGVGILAASIPETDPGSVPAGKKPSSFAIKSGTSMACPHVTGAAAFVKAAHPGWSPSMIRSALMTTATAVNNQGKPVTSSSGLAASPLDAGAGEVSPLRALSPGLVFDTTTQDYLHFLCYYGYKEQAISRVAKTNFTCQPAGSSAVGELIASVNYPSISVAALGGGKPVTVARTVTNVGPAEAVYVAAVTAPAGVDVSVLPARLEFSKKWATASYVVTFRNAGAAKGYGFGAVEWSDGAHTVRTVFAVRAV